MSSGGVINTLSGDADDVNDRDTLIDGEGDDGGEVAFENDVAGIAPEDVTKGEARRFPFSLYFIIVCEFCERFCYYGMRAVLTLYFLLYFDWEEDDAVVLYHSFVMLCYITPLFGGMLADSSLGKFKTILILSVVYCAGTAVMSATAIPGLTGDPPSPAGAMIGLSLIAIGTGGIKPCVASFGGDQIDRTNTAMIETYFAAFYFSINGGSFISTVVTPKLRADVGCFDRDDCYSLAFGVPCILMIIALIMFVAGKPYYKKAPKPDRNVIADFLLAVKLGLRAKFRAIGSKRYGHWLDAGRKELDRDFIEHTKIALRVMWLFLPLPVFWALYDQSGSRWTVQASQMETFSMGPFGEFRPDQMQAVNSLLILLMIPFFQRVVYPSCRSMGLKCAPLTRMALGMVLCASAFIIAGVLQITIDEVAGVPVAPTGAALYRVINTTPNPATLVVDVSGSPVRNFSSTLELAPRSSMAYTTVDADSVELQWTTMTGNDTTVRSLNIGSVYTDVLYTAQDGSTAALQVNDAFGIEEEAAVTSARVKLVHVAAKHGLVTVSSPTDNGFDEVEVGYLNVSDWASGRIDSGKQKVEVRVNDTVEILNSEFDFIDSAWYTVVLTDNDDDALSIYSASDKEQVSIAWQLPQYVVITAGEILFSITGLEFAYSQAPQSMKAILQAAWLMTTAFGSLIVIIVAESKFFDSQATEFFFFSGLLGGVTAIFTVMTMFYQYSDGLEAHNEKDADGDASTAPLISDSVEG